MASIKETTVTLDVNVMVYEVCGSYKCRSTGQERWRITKKDAFALISSQGFRCVRYRELHTVRDCESCKEHRYCSNRPIWFVPERSIYFYNVWIPTISKYKVLANVCKDSTLEYRVVPKYSCRKTSVICLFVRFGMGSGRRTDCEAYLIGGDLFQHVFLLNSNLILCSESLSQHQLGFPIMFFICILHYHSKGTLV